MNKQTLRKIYSDKRNSLSNDQIEELSRSIADNFLNSGLGEYKNFFCYNSMKSEVKTDFLVEKLLAFNKNVYFPKTTGRTLEFIAYHGQPFVKGSFGVFEPIGRVSKDKPDVCIMPALAVDLNGNRLGYGGGCYDRFLAGTSCIKAALVFECQIAESLNAEPFDIPVDFIVTERKIINLRK